MSNKKTIWLQITSGQGPKECCWVVAQLTQKILQEASRYGIQAELVERLAYEKALRNQSLIEPETYLSSLIRLEGSDVDSFAKSWAGVIKWKGFSPYRANHKRCNWFVGVDLVSVDIKNHADSNKLVGEVEFTAMRSSGAGGQHVNKTSSAVRLTHRPTGIQLRVDADRSQYRNKQLALERLQLILAEKTKEKVHVKIEDRWKKHYQVKRGSPIRIFKGEKFIEEK